MGLLDTIKRWQEKERLKRDNKIKSIQLRGRIIQFFESYDILTSTKNIETLESRVIFINTFYSQFIIAHTDTFYKSAINIAAHSYKKMYPNRELKKAQLELVSSPSIVHLKTLVAGCIVVCFSRYADEQNAEIQRLKQKSAIEKRKEKVVNIGYNAKTLFETFDLDTMDRHFDEIDGIRKHFYHNI